MSINPPISRPSDSLEDFFASNFVRTLPDRPDLDFYDLLNPVILGWVVDVTHNRTTYPFGTFTHSADDPVTWYFRFDEFGWSAWDDAAGLMRGLHYAMTGQKFPEVAR